MLPNLALRFVWWAASIAGAVGNLACSAEGPVRAASGLGQGEQAFVNGDDDRREYFQLGEPTQRAALEQFSVALMTDSAAAAVIGGQVNLLPTWGEVNELCDGEPFVDQPSAAFCSGVLLDWDLVLTSGHCVDAVHLDQLRVAFNYYYRAEGELAMSEDDSYAVARIVATRRDPGTSGDDSQRLDYAWIELAEPVHPPHRPAATYTRSR
ncbi:MAG TPA: trypsin-like serine protease, partial [Polyangiaceae bacterium]|nr:trypsin-like serine protease [Polyangiaceae bacterium]